MYRIKNRVRDSRSRPTNQRALNLRFTKGDIPQKTKMMVSARRTNPADNQQPKRGIRPGSRKKRSPIQDPTPPNLNAGHPSHRKQLDCALRPSP